MGVKSYVAGMKADSIEQATDLAFGALNVGANIYERKKALDAAKDKTDINRESKGVQSTVDQFLNDLQYDRDYQNYNQRVEEKFGEISSSIQDNPLLSDSARRELNENLLPQLKQETMGRAGILGTNAQMAEIEVEIEGFGDTIASDPNMDLVETVSTYRSHIEDLGIYNDATVGKMVDEFSYTTSPMKALQTLQGEYQEKYLDDGFSMESRIGELGSELGLDGLQLRALGKSAAEFQSTFDRQVDARFSEQKDILLGEIAGTKDGGQMFDIESIDALLPQVPARHRLELYKAKNTAMANNDGILFETIGKAIDDGHVFTPDDWKMMDLFNDPGKRDEVSERLLVNQGNALLSSGKTIVEARSAIEGFEGPVSLKNRTEAKARLTKAYLDRESDVSVIAKDLLNSAGSSATVPTPSKGGNIDVGSPVTVNDDDRSQPPIESIPGSEEEPATEKEAEELSEGSSPVDVPSEVPGRDGNTSPWSGAYEDKVAERRDEVRQERAEFETRLDTQARHVQAVAGVAAQDSRTNQRPLLHRDMSQTDLVISALQTIKDGEGRYIQASELALIRDDQLRQELTTMAGIRDSLTVDSPIALDFIDQLRRDPAVSEDKLRLAVMDFVDRGFIKADTAEGGGLTKKYSFAQNSNSNLLQSMIRSVVSAIYPTKTGTLFETKRTYLSGVLEKAADDAIAMNPDLLGKDFSQLQKQIEAFAVEKTSEGILDDLGDVSRLMAEGNVSRRIDNLERSDVSTFLQDIQDGRYDLLVNWDFVQRPEMRSSRHDKKDILLDKVAKGLTPYKDYKDLEKNGTQFELLRVMANTSFILAGGTLEKSLEGSFGIKPKDMKVAGRQWAFADPEADGLYFIATDTDLEGRGTLGWGMANADYDGVKGLVMFRDYVDPKLAYDIENLKSQIDDPLFDRKKTTADQNRNQFPLGTAGLGYSPIKVQQSLDDRYYSVIEDYESKTKELGQLTKDIMTYRQNLLGTRSE
ncbi:MAG: hypothetical protein AB7S52_08960, partial [Sphaerochaetaceae bacterium]